MNDSDAFREAEEIGKQMEEPTDSLHGTRRRRSHASNDSPFKRRVPLLRWIEYARRSWQRLGHLTMVSSLAHPATGTTLEGLTSRFEEVITRPHDVPPELQGQVSEYIRSHRRNRYSNGHDLVHRVELQDLYLSDGRLPSKSGAITGNMQAAGYRHAVYVEIPAWGVRLRLLRQDNYTLTDRGRALLKVRAGNSLTLRSFDPSVNPFLLTEGECYFFLYCILDADGDLIRKLLPALSVRGKTFTRSEVGERLMESLKALSVERLSGVNEPTARALSRRIAATVSSVAKQRGLGMGPRESIATPRTEPLVDCGLLCRTDDISYSYRLPDSACQFAMALSSAESLDDFLELHLAESTARLRGKPRERDTSGMLPFIGRSYQQLRSGLGYCSIREVALLAVALALDAESGLFELRDVERAISDMGRTSGDDVRFTKSRQGDVAQFRMSTRMLAGFH